MVTDAYKCLEKNIQQSLHKKLKHKWYERFFILQISNIKEFFNKWKMLYHMVKKLKDLIEKDKTEAQCNFWMLIDDTKRIKSLIGKNQLITHPIEVYEKQLPIVNRVESDIQKLHELESRSSLLTGYEVDRARGYAYSHYCQSDDQLVIESLWLYIKK
jgi:hypothetical protein